MASLMPYVRLDNQTTDDVARINSVRTKLAEKNEMVVGAVSFAALEHAAKVMTHADESVVDSYHKLRRLKRSELAGKCRHVVSGVKEWVNDNRVKTVLMLVGLGGTALKAHTMSLFITNEAQSFIQWGNTTTRTFRFLGFVILMILRLMISTLIPPTSPAFGIIIQAATPEDEKWTAMPFFLLASAVAGAFPYVMDKILQVCRRKDFRFTMFMKRFAEVWPLTCWTEPVMRTVFRSSGGGKTGATLAIIFAHAAPFMGAQTTCMQRFFLPHPIDTIISQPFGMSEDLISMAMAEARTDPSLASKSLTAILAFLNFGQYFVFSNRTDRRALAIAILNTAVGFLVVIALARNVRMPFAIVGVQLMNQMLLVPLIVRIASDMCASKEASLERVESSTSFVGSLVGSDAVPLGLERI